jgi:hypothetical protein
VHPAHDLAVGGNSITVFIKIEFLILPTNVRPLQSRCEAPLRNVATYTGSARARDGIKKLTAIHRQGEAPLPHAILLETEFLAFLRSKTEFWNEGKIQLILLMTINHGQDAHNTPARLLIKNN